MLHLKGGNLDLRQLKSNISSMKIILQTLQGSWDIHMELFSAITLGRGGGPVVGVLALYYDDLSSNPAGY